MILRTELMIGNLLNYNGELFKVSTIGETTASTLTDKCRKAVLYTDLKPIPLTPEWLERAGFVAQPKREGIYHYGRLQIYIGNFGMAYLLEEDTLLAHYIPNNVYYVHQLQNLVFALTGTELEFN